MINLTYSSNMTRTRLFMGLSSSVYGISAILFAEGGISKLMAKGTWEDWTWPIALVLCGGLMAMAALQELLGERRRRFRELSSFLLGCVWIAVFFQTLEDGQVDPLTLQAVLYVIFCTWAWCQDAITTRKLIIAKGALL